MMAEVTVTYRMSDLSTNNVFRTFQLLSFCLIFILFVLVLSVFVFLTQRVSETSTYIFSNPVKTVFINL